MKLVICLLPFLSLAFGQHVAPVNDCIPAPMNCALSCPSGLQKDVNGCDTCNCMVDMCQTTLCDTGLVCQSQPCTTFPCEGLEARCVAPSDSTCPLVSCMVNCPYGAKKNAAGCEICECVDPCENLKCSAGQLCKVQPNVCVGIDCQVTTTMGQCIAKPHCQLVLEKYQEALASGKALPVDHEPRCDDDHHWEPTQCWQDQCWCVHEDGTEVEGSRVLILNPTEKPNCNYNRTTSAHLSFNMEHQIEQIKQEHLDEMKQMMNEHVARWLTVQKTAIVEVTVTPHAIHVIRVEITIIREEDVDLAASLVLFQERIEIENFAIPYHGQDLKPLPSTVHIQKNYDGQRGSAHGPEPVENPIGCFTENFKTYYAAHPAIVIVGVITVGLVVLLLATICVTCCCKSRRQRLQKCEIKNYYEKNLAFDTPQVIVGDVEKVKLADHDECNKLSEA